MNSSLRRWLQIIGGALCVVGVAFVVLRFNVYIEQIDLDRFDASAWSLVGLLAIVYAASNVFLAQAWWNLLVFFDTKVERRLAIKTYGLSQLAKYVPGNIFHLAGRQALGMAAGWPASAIAKSAIWEIGLITCGGVLFGFLAAPLAWPELPVFVSAAMFVSTTVGVVFTLHRLSPCLGAALIWQIVFLSVSGAVFMGALSVIAPSVVTLSVVSALCGAYVIAWLGGLVTPGAPAGVGVRELILLFLFGSQLQQVDLLLAIVLGRLVTVGGDLLFFAAVSTIKVIEKKRT